MAWYKAGSIAISGTTVTGTGTNWSDNKMGVGTGQALLVPGAGTVRMYEILRVDSATRLTLTTDAGSVPAGQAYAIMSFYTDSVPDFARRLSAQLSYYQSQMDGWQQIMTGSGSITLTDPNGMQVTISSFKKLTDDMNNKADMVGGAVPVEQGGTGARDAPGARKSLGLSPDDAVAFSYIDAVQAPKCTGTVNTNSGAISLNINIKSVTYIDLGHYRVEFTRRLQAGYVPFAGIITASAPGILVASDCSITSQSNAGFDVWVYDAAGASYRNPDYLTICVYGRFE